MSDAAAAAPAAPTDNNGDPGLNGSWVELEMNRNSSESQASSSSLATPALAQVVEEDDGIAGGLEHVPSSSSIHNGDMEKILLDAQHESSRSNSSCDRLIIEMGKGKLEWCIHSCIPPAAPHDPTVLRMKARSALTWTEEKLSWGGLVYSSSLQPVHPVFLWEVLEKMRDDDILMKDSDWVADWSSRPENIPPKEFHFRHPRRSVTLSMRKTGAMKKGGIFSAEFLRVFIPSLLLSHILALGLGVYIGKRLTTPPASSF
ncbi:hypothetical protein NFI96_017826 [Prochilodus magdalenae]|nr:hypothetical protein NFI96_017826 [Prochilodus magdalenae]